MQILYPVLIFLIIATNYVQPLVGPSEQTRRQGSPCSSGLLSNDRNHTCNQLENNPYLLLNTKTLPKKPHQKNSAGFIIEVTEEDFPILSGKKMTTFVNELFHEGMRVPHWHPDASELGYVARGKMSVTLWKSPGEVATTFTVSEGQMWFIPKGALHYLNNLLDETLELLVSFDATIPGAVDLSPSWDAIPIPILKAMVNSPHNALLRWRETANIGNIYTLSNPRRDEVPSPEADISSPYSISLKAVVPLQSRSNLGEAIWVTKANWPILKESGISMLRSRSSPSTAIDPIWWPNADSLFSIVSGKAEWMILDADAKKYEFIAHKGDMVFVPRGYLYTYRNLECSEYVVIQIFNTNLPQLAISLAVSTWALPIGPRNDALFIPDQPDLKILSPHIDAFADLKFPIITPFFLHVKAEDILCEEQAEDKYL